MMQIDKVNLPTHEDLMISREGNFISQFKKNPPLAPLIFKGGKTERSIKIRYYTK
jgi:hypothetical protein